MRLLLALLATMIFLATVDGAGAATATLHGTVSSGSGDRTMALKDATVTVYRVDFDTADPNKVFPGMPAGSGVSDGDGHFAAVVQLCDPGACTSLFYAVADVRSGVALATVIGPTISADSIVIFVGLAAPVMPVPYSAPPQRP